MYITMMLYKGLATWRHNQLDVFNFKLLVALFGQNFYALMMTPSHWLGSDLCSSFSEPRLW